MTGSRRLEGGEQGPILSQREIAECLFSEGSLGFRVRGRDMRLVATSDNPGRLSHVIVPQRREEGVEEDTFVDEGRYAGITPAAAVEGLLQGRGYIVGALSNAVLEAKSRRS
jgi:hypothetical protein